MLLPNWLPGFWLKVISQPWEGDVTMVLPSMVWQIKKAISNPSKEELYLSLKQVRLVHLVVAVLCDFVCRKQGFSHSFSGGNAPVICMWLPAAVSGVPS